MNIEDLRQDVNNHDGLLKEHENIIRGKNSRIEENFYEHLEMGNEFPSIQQFLMVHSSFIGSNQASTEY